MIEKWIAQGKALAVTMVEAYVQGGKAKPVLPEGRRDEVVSVLTFLMAAPDGLEAYVAALDAERRRRGPEVELRLLGMAGLDIPDSQIAAEGFAGLDDDHLADIALSPEAICALQEYLDEPETERGMWFFEGILKVEAARPDAAESARRAEEIYQDLKNRRLID
jgi:hypothetical protein